MSENKFVKQDSAVDRDHAEFTVIIRSVARQMRFVHYFTGKECSRGHIAKRFVKSGQCEECKRNWRVNNLTSYKTSHRKYRETNRTPELKRKKLWRQNNLAKGAAYSAKRRTRKQNATPNWSEEQLIHQLFSAANYLTRLTGIQWDVDHIIPIKHENVCGLHVYQNLQLLPRLDNLIKWCKFESSEHSTVFD
jgi:hypothetical protein